MKAILRNYRQAPRKVRLVTDLIKGKKIDEAELQLSFLVKRASDPIKKLLLSAVANAKNNFNLDRNNLFVKNVRVDKGIVLKRIMPRARGSASRINKRTSHVFLEVADLSEKIDKKNKNKKENKDNKDIEKKLVKNPLKKISPELKKTENKIKSKNNRKEK